MRILLLLALLSFAPSARADVRNEYERVETGRWHLAIETTLVAFRRIAADPRGDYVRPGQDVAQLAYADALGFRVGYLWTSGWELGAGLDVGAWRNSVQRSSARSVRVAPAAYLRYLFPGGSTRGYVGGIFGGEFAGTNSANTALDEDGLPTDVTVRSRGFSFGPEGGVRIQAADWLSINPFLRWQILLGRTKFSQLPGDFDERGWRVVIGFAASFWI